MRLRTPVATLSSLAALAALALAPAPAAAVINNPGANCIPPNPGDQVFWNNGSWCQVQEGQGGPAGTGSAAGAASGGGATIYWASSDAPRDPVVECLRQNAGTCMPVQRGGRDVLESKNGTIAGQRGGSGSKAAGKSEVGRGKARPSKEECEKLRNGGFIAPYDAEIGRMDQEITSLNWEIYNKGLEITNLEGKVKKLTGQRDSSWYRRGMPDPWEKAVVEAQLASATFEKDKALGERLSMEKRMKKREAERTRRAAEAERATRAVVFECGAAHGRQPRPSQ
jgi:hypothetical protein